MSDEERIYCKNCKWYRAREWGMGGFLNSCRVHEIHGRSYLGSKTIDCSKAACCDHNADFDCIAYQRKWWKPWARQHCFSREKYLAWRLAHK